MKRIWKYPVQLGENIIEMPRDAKIISVGACVCGLAIWAEVRPGNAIVRRKITLYDTGEDVPEYPGDYIGTVIDGVNVCHAYSYGPVAETLH